MDLQIVTPRQSLPRKQAYIATSNRKVDNEVMEKKIMLGNEAFARGAYEAGVKVVSPIREHQVPRSRKMRRNMMRYT